MEKLVWVSGSTVLALLCVGGWVIQRTSDPAQTLGADFVCAPTVEQNIVSPPAPVEGFTGVVVHPHKVDAAARADGVVMDVRVRMGDQVPRDALLVQLDDRQARSELEVARAMLGAIRSEEEKATLELQEAQERNARNQKAASLREDALSQQELASAHYQEQYAASSLSAVRARVKEQQARVGQLEQRIRDEAIRAPFDGVVTARYVDPGAAVSRGTPLVRLVSADALWVRFAVPEEWGHALAANVAVEARINDLKLAVPGLIEKVSPEVDSASRMIIAEARLTPSAMEQAPGLLGRVVRVHLLQPPHRTARPTP